ncbi:hypothetical protein [Shimia thalassica]|nr:hypothetical protein [Shimia thalassica]
MHPDKYKRRYSSIVAMMDGLTDTPATEPDAMEANLSGRRPRIA